MPKKRAKEAPEELLDSEGEAPRARPFWSGTISFGLVTIPVDLYSATRSTRTSLRMLAPDGTPVARRYFDANGRELDSEQLERGYELDDGDFVVVTDEELDALAPEQSRDIDLTRFVDRDSIPPLFFERAYILAPSGNTNLAYRLLASTLERTGRAGIASFVMRAKQYIVAIVSEKGLLRAETLRFAEELRAPDAIGLPAVADASAQKVKAFRAAIHKEQGGSPSASELADDYWKRLEKLAEKKLKGGEDVVHPEPLEEEEENLAEVIDLVAVLRKSLGQSAANDGEAAAERTPARKTASRSTRKTPSKAKRKAPSKAARKTPSKAPRKAATKRRAPGAGKARKKAPRKAPAKRAAKTRRAS